MLRRKRLGSRPGRAAQAVWGAALITLAVGVLPARTASKAVPADGLTAAPAAPAAMDEVAFLPLSVRGRWIGAVSGAATAAARAATSSAATSVAGTATAAAGTVTSPATHSSPSPSPTESAQTPTPSATITPGGPTLTPRPSSTPVPTATDSWGPWPGPTRDPPDPSLDTLRQAGAEGYGRTLVEEDAQSKVVRLTAARAAPIIYEIDFTHPDNAAGRLTVREVASNRFPIAGGGLYYQTAEGQLYAPRMLGIVGRLERLEYSVVTNGVVITVTERLQEVLHQKSYDVRLSGRALRVRFRSLDGIASSTAGGYVAAATGLIEGTRDGVNVRLPLMESVPVTMIERRWFVSSLHDHTTSRADAVAARGPEQIPGAFVNEMVAFYSPDTSGAIAAVDETFHVILSPELTDLFAVTRGGSDHAPRLRDRALVTLDGDDVSFDTEADYVAQLGTYRMDDLVVVKRGWHDTSVSRPAQGPPAADLGGPAGFVRLLEAAPALAPELDYTRTVPPCPGHGAPLYSPSDRLAHSDGSFKTYPEETVPCGGSPAVPAYLLAPDRAAQLAAGPAGPPAGAQAAFVNGLGTWSPAFAATGADGNLVDRGREHASDVRSTVIAVKNLLATVQRTAGPVFTDGPFGPWELGFTAFFNGYVDGATGELATGSPDGAGASRQIVVPDFAHSLDGRQIARFGMGDYERFFGPIEPGGLFPLTEAHLDELRATELAFGFGAAWSARPGAADDPLSAAEQAREYFLIKPIVTRMRASGVTNVHYIQADGSALTLSEALKTDLDLARPRLVLGIAGEGTIWVNHSEETWRVLVDGFSYYLPLHGWLVQDERSGVFGYSALHDERHVDYLDAPEWTVLDGRGAGATVGELTSRDLLVVFPDGARLEEAADGSLSLRGG